MLKIGIFSKLSRISIRMLRHYDEIGLLVPKIIDDFTGYRYYDVDQLTIANRIASLRDMGFGLAAIGEIMHSYSDPEALMRFLSIKHAQMQAEADATAHRLLLLETAMNRLRKDETAMNYDVTIKTLPERYVCSTRQIIPSYEHEHILWETMMKETAPQKVQPADNYCGLAIFHDKGFKESDVDVEVQGTLKGSYQNTEHVTFKTVPAIEVAAATYRGSYEQLPDVNRAVANWVNDNGYEFDGAMLCIYHVSPAQAASPDELVTEVCYPVKKK